MRKKILVVEDSAELLELLRLNFEAAGFAISTATNGVEALEKARSFSPDLVLLDLLLPELDGFAVCEILRHDPATASVPVIMLTGVSGQLARYAGLESGASEYVSKPASPKELVSRIRTLLQSSAAERKQQTASRKRIAPVRARAGERRTIPLAPSPKPTKPKAKRKYSTGLRSVESG